MYANQYEEHLAHSASCASRWDGFDRGTTWAGEELYGEKIIGRMTSEAGRRVVIVEEFGPDCEAYRVEINGKVVFSCDNNRPRAIRVARWWMDGCPA